MEKIPLEQRQIIKQKIGLKDNRFIVRIEITNSSIISREDTKRNVYCINENYEKIWQIRHDPKCPHPNVPFVDININIKGNALIAKDFAGFIYTVDIDNGEAEVISWNK